MNRHPVIAGLVGLVLMSCWACHETLGPSARLYEGFGSYHRAISTNSKQAQQWFDQGMQLLYGFNHDEAVRSFEAAMRLDPDCAIAAWGVAYAHGMHINKTDMSDDQSRLAWQAAQHALTLVERASPVEAALIRAVTTRYEWPAPADRRHLNQAYADAMQQAAATFPDDPDVGALFAESLMDLQPWDLWQRDGSPKGRTEEIVATLEHVLAIAPDHPGANHFYIHTVEASQQPERGLDSADRLADLVPGAGHLVHMPAHIYARVGRYSAAADANVRAIAVDRAYFVKAPPPEFYSLYFVHNLHFLAWAAMMEGCFDTAIAAARDLEADIPESFLREFPQFADGFMPVTYHVLIRFGRFDAVLAEPEPPAFRHISRTLRHYARGVALSALGRTAEARLEREQFEVEAALIPDSWMIGTNHAAPVIAVARHMLEGELAWREQRNDAAFASLREGARLEDLLTYDEPPAWMQPVRHALGALLMRAGRAAEAEAVYREDLARNPGNGWAHLGLANALAAQGQHAAADQQKAALASAWPRSDVRPTSSCYCEPQ